MAKRKPKSFAASDALLTGFPGFLARHLIDELAERMTGGTLWLLVESRFRNVAQARLEAIIRDHGELPFEARIVEGDITAPDLGLGEHADALKKSVGVVWHLAAIYDLAVPELQAYRVNVGGTSNVLDFCEACKDLKRLNYVSTCFVSGEREGMVFEDELDEGQAHRNHYEATKFWAEVEVQRRFEDVPTTIFRPAIVVGHSVTGETDKYDGPYYFLKLVRKYPDWLPFPNIGSGRALVNMVPIDYVAAALAELGLAPGHEGETYQLADPSPMRARDIVSLTLELMNKTGSVGSVPPSLVSRVMENDRIEEKLGLPREVVRYFTHDARYDTTEVERALEGTGIRCPHLSSYLQVLIDYVDLHPDQEFLDRRRI